MAYESIATARTGPGPRAPATVSDAVTSRTLIWVCSLLVAFLTTSCGHFVRLKRDVRRLESDTRLSGHVVSATGQTGRVIIIVLTRTGKSSPQFLDLAILAPWENDFAFSVPPVDTLRVAAFRDQNNDGIFQNDEPLWVSKELTAGDQDADRRFPVQEVVFQPGLSISPDLLSSLREARAGRPLEDLAGGHQMRISLGLITDFESPRFTRDAANLGFWEPVEFMNRHGAGIYFLEPYDPKRIPVLLLHGAGGSPGDWKSLVGKLDHSKHQFWLLAYPSGLRIGDSATMLTNGIERLHQRYQFSQLDVLAHSMGGLVARQFLLGAPGSESHYPGQFITISAPWGGHESASLGVNYAPTAIPCWLDLQSGSEFQTKLFERTLPSNRPYHLVFSFRGSGTIVLPDSNDGVVSIASQLTLQAQREARSVRGFNETHSSILTSDETAAWLNELLATVIAKP